MCDLLVGLQREPKSVWNNLRPLQEQILRRHAIKRVIDLDRGELLRVKAKHVPIGKLLGVKISLPFLIRVSRGSYPKLAHVRNNCTSALWHLITAAVLE